MTKLYLIRHAEAEGNLFRRMHGQYNSRLTEIGLRQVKLLAKRLAEIPFDAVYYDDDQAYVFVAEKGDGSDKAVRKNVTAGAYNNEMIVILEGLSEGDQVITTWGAGLKDGAAIEVIHSGSGSETEEQADPLST
jgi:hypothetical protein